MNNRLTIAAALAAGLLVQTQGFAVEINPTAAESLESLLQTPAVTGVFPGQVALGWYYYLTARDGGGQIVNALTATATTIGPNERFTVEQVGNYLSFLTANGNYISVSEGLPPPDQVTETVLTSPADTTLFSITPYATGLGAGFHLDTYYGYQMYWKPGQSTAATGDVPNGTNPGPVATGFMPQQCGNLGSGYHYSLAMLAPGFEPGLVASNQLGATGGLIKGGVYIDNRRDLNEQLTLIQQEDGTYALQLSNGTNYVTAVNGGGLAHGTAESDNLHTDATRVGSWEKFRITDQGNCTYTLQTTSGYYLGYKLNDNSPTGPGGLSLTTDISFPADAPSIGYSSDFVLLPLWN
jgi:hypothetical protein